MTDLARLEANAEAKRSRLEATLRRLEQRATVVGLVDDTIARIGAPTAGEVAEALRRNPVLAAGLALCAGLIALEVIRARKRQTINGRHSRKVVQSGHKLDQAEPKETYHGSRRSEHQ